jgi:predicted secreted protein
MAKTKVLARNWKIEIDTDPLATMPTGTAVWTKIAGVNTFTISNDKEDTDTTDFDSNGYNEHLVASRSNEVSFEGFFIEDQTNGQRDAGQEAVEKYGDKIGPEAMATIRLTSPGGKVRQFKGSFAVGDVGGGNNDATSWGASFTPSGAPITVTA